MSTFLKIKLNVGLEFLFYLIIKKCALNNNYIKTFCNKSFIEHLNIFAHILFVFKQL